MNLKIPAIYSQRDPQWASLFLGNNTSMPFTIGLYGCLITCLGMYVGKTPKEVNTILTPNGFPKGSGEFIWSQSTLLGINQTYLSPRYDGIPVSAQGFTKIQQLLDSGFPLLCEIDFNPNTDGEEMHYVLLYGYDKDTYYAADPWTGTLIDLSVYGGAARAIIQFRAYDKVLPKDDGTTAVSVESKIFENLVRKSTIYDVIQAKLNVQDSQTIVLAEIDKLVSYEDAVGQKDKQLAEAQATIAQLKTDSISKETDLKTLQAAAADLTEKVNKAVEENQTLQKRLQEAEQASQTPVLQGWRLALYKFLLRK